MEMLLDYEIECGVSMISYSGDTALSCAVRAGEYDVVCLLADSGRVEDLADKSGQTLNVIAREQGNANIERVLTELAEKLRA